ncbi:VOC family protein [Ramlibacter rhizophilus]|uniref:VOC family protein n=1 Tax=Ramlibacter rhizophilus TaxID=1781167 RepID=A0A4Z0BZS2_9BURK|nr:VOC family protein [Ramlibacter rhizophilus]TFZ03459.1 VOC family protein [Ramlibacter rhizophilus]
MAPASSSGASERDRRPELITSISAVTLATHDMARAVRFYTALGFVLRYGGAAAAFSSFSAGSGCLNVTTEGSERAWSWWGRIIFHVADVDRLYAQAVGAGLQPQAPPRDATWGERYFHISDPDGHELSFATPLGPPPPTPA